MVARGTPGFSGADLANLANEAAIVAVRGNREVLTAADFDDARDRILLGRREGSNVLLPEEKHAVAVHEAGHALVAALSDHADPVAKVTILPAGQALGVTQQLPLVERHLYGEDYLNDSWRCGWAAGPRSWSSSARARPARPTTWPAPPTWRPRWSASSACPRSSARSATPRAARCSWAAAGRAVQPAVRRGHPGRHRPRGGPAAARGRAERDRQDPRAPRPARPAGHPAAGAARPWTARRSTGSPAARCPGRHADELTVAPRAVATADVHHNGSSG